jgi:hypothetical protein
MSDREGLLTLPMVEAGDPASSAVGDPLLDVLGAFLMASVNADTKAGWSVVTPRPTPPHTTSVPISRIFTHNPDKSSFTSSQLPALFLWRASWPKLTPFSQDWKAQVSQVSALWCPAQESFDKDAMRDPMRNAIAKSIHRNIERGRHPAWKVVGDTDPKAEDYGSFLLNQLNVAKTQVTSLSHVPLSITKGDREYPYDALLASIEVTELLVPLLDDYYADTGLNGAVTLGESPLTYLSFEFKPTVSAVSPSTGTLSGGTTITVRGAQFFEDDNLDPLRVHVGDVACTNVVLVDGNTITATTPAGAAGAQTVKVTLPNGASASLASAFTYV